MTYGSIETSVESSQPVEFYDFTIGSTVYHYTSAPDDFSFLGNSYVHKSVHRNDPNLSMEERRSQVEITLPTGDPVANWFIGIPPADEMTCEIYRFHRGDTNYILVWSGVIAGIKYDKQGTNCTLRGVTSEAAFSKKFPRFVYQSSCNHVLYDSICKVVKASHAYTNSVSAESGLDITVTGLSAKGAGWAVGGFISLVSGDHRLIIAQSGDVISIYIPFRVDLLGETVTVQAGCDHLIATCDTKFSNLLNFGGYPSVPQRNIFQTGL